MTIILDMTHMLTTISSSLGFTSSQPRSITFDNNVFKAVIGDDKCTFTFTTSSIESIVVSITTTYACYEVEFKKYSASSINSYVFNKVHRSVAMKSLGYYKHIKNVDLCRLAIDVHQKFIALLTLAS